jgi:ABC-type Fe3+ transport system permease subunit
MSTPHALKSFRDLLNDSIASYRQHLNPIITLSVIVGVLYLLLNWNLPQGNPTHFSLFAVLFGLTYFIGAMLVSIAIYSLLHGKTKDVSSLLSESLPKLLPVLLASILAALIVAGGFLLLIVPGIIFGIWYTFIVPVVLFEKKTGMDALKQSREYARGRWWAIFGRFILLCLVMLVAVIVVSIVVSIVAAIFGPAAKSLNNLFSIFVLTPIATIFSYHLYRSAAGKS